MAEVNNLIPKENEVVERDESFESVLNETEKLGVSESDDEDVMIEKPFKSKPILASDDFEEESSKIENISSIGKKFNNDINGDKPDLIKDNDVSITLNKPKSPNNSDSDAESSKTENVLQKVHNDINEDNPDLITVDNEVNIELKKLNSPNNFLKLIDSDNDGSIDNDVGEKNQHVLLQSSLLDSDIEGSQNSGDDEVVMIEKPFKSKPILASDDFEEESSKIENISSIDKNFNNDINGDKPDLIKNDEVSITLKPKSPNNSDSDGESSKTEKVLQKVHNDINEDNPDLITVDNVVVNIELKKLNSPNNFLKLIDSDTDESIDNDVGEKNEHGLQSSLLDSDIEGSQNSGDNENNHTIMPETTNIRPAKRDSAKTALDHIKAIKSETQRLARESNLSIPYHKPRSHTLKEFMNRKTISKPDSSQKTKSMRSSVKMNAEDLEKFAKHLEERAKEAREFFRSESDEEYESKPKISRSSAESITKREEPLANSVAAVQISADYINESTQIKESTSGEYSNVEHHELTQSEEKPKNMLNVDNLKKMLVENEISNKPMLKGDYNTVIDLESGDIIPRKPSGVDNLLQKFLIHCNKRRTKADSNKEKSIPPGVIPNDEETGELKPGQALLKLKTELKKIITTKRKEELLKRFQENNVPTKEVGSDDDGDENMDNELDTDSELDGSCKDDEEDFEEEDFENMFEDKEALEEDNHNGGDEDDEDADDELDTDNEIDEHEDQEGSNSKQRTRIVTELIESDNESLSDFDKKIENDSIGKTDELWRNEDLNESGESENELMNLCTGQFNKSDCSENVSSTIDANNILEISQIPTTTNDFQISQLPSTQIGKDVDESELLDLCSGTFHNNNEPNSTDEGNSDDEIGTMRRNKKTRKISVSDDEQEEDEKEEHLELDTADENLDAESNASEVNEVEPDTYVDYDSEENEIEVKMTKSDWKKKATEFVENEAELSESEWGSADEDEKDLDRYDIELADEEEFDKDKLHTELERIHMRRVLDDDIREVKKIQELLFEDEENDGVGRKRQFKWKNADKNFNLDHQPDNDENKVDGEGSDGENEELWRKMRHERETILTEKERDIKSISNSNTPNTDLSKKKINVLKNGNRNSTSSNTSSPFLILKDKQFSEARGSFLVRDKETLSKLAMLTKSTGTESDGIVSTVQMSSSKARNFVFAAIQHEPENQQNTKRKSDAIQSKGDDSHIPDTKKQKFSRTPRPVKERLLDHL